MNGAQHGLTGWPRRRGRAILLATSLLLGACDLTVVNPSSMVDEDLDNPVTLPAIVYGVIGDYGRSLTGASTASIALFSASALLTDELVGSGLAPGTQGLSDGESEDYWSEANTRWSLAARARWVANRGFNRVSAMVANPAADPNLAVIKLYAGFANRTMGDHFCQAVRDVGPLEPHTVYYEEAEQHFTKAIEIASAALAAGDTAGVRPQEHMRHVLSGAYAGRAQVRMQLGKWDQAVADAAEVPIQYIHSNTYSELGLVRNYLTYTARLDFSATVWGTPFMDWGINTSLPVAQISGDFRVQWWPIIPPADSLGVDRRRVMIRQSKHVGLNNPVANVRGTEMRLIEGEAALLRGDWQTAIDKINEVRTFRNLSIGTPSLRMPMVAASNATEAWHLHMRERGIEMWLEGRRIADLRRWADTPGKDMFPFTVIRRAAPTANPRDDQRVSVYDVAKMCLEVGRNEKITNPNIGG